MLIHCTMLVQSDRAMKFLGVGGRVAYSHVTKCQYRFGIKGMKSLYVSVDLLLINEINEMFFYYQKYVLNLPEFDTLIKE